MCSKYYSLIRPLLYTVHCTMYSVQCTLYNVQCTMYSVQCKMYSVLLIFLIAYASSCTVYTLYMYAIYSIMSNP